MLICVVHAKQMTQEHRGHDTSPSAAFTCGCARSLMAGVSLRCRASAFVSLRPQQCGWNRNYTRVGGKRRRWWRRGMRAKEGERGKGNPTTATFCSVWTIESHQAFAAKSWLFITWTQTSIKKLLTMRTEGSRHMQC